MVVFEIDKSSVLKSPSCIFSLFRRLPAGVLQKFRTGPRIRSRDGVLEIRGCLKSTLPILIHPGGVFENVTRAPII